MWRRDVNYVLRWITFICLITILTKGATGLRGSAVVLQAKAKAAELKEAGIEEAAVEADETSVNGTSTNSTQPVKLKSLLTGIPQKDYIYDPNLPRELNGHNLTNYPFYNAVPPDIEFDCDGLHDGFYASVPHKCQVYHHCLFGTRYDFLCANYTAFDQKTFICHFVSEVDCQNSPKYYKRNEALYKAATTSPPPTTARPQTTTTTTTTTQAPPPVNSAPRNRGHRPFRARGRPYRRRRPVVYEYYYDGDDYDADGDYYYDDEPPERERQQPRGKGNRKHQPSSHGQGYRDDDSPKGHGRPYGEPEAQQATSTEAIKPSVRPSSSQSTLSGSSVYDRPRVPPKIRRPVPINERDKYDYTQQTTDVGPAPTAETAKNKKTQARRPVSYDDYYDDEEDDDYPEEQPPKYKKGKTPDFEAEPSSTSDSRRPVSSRHRLRVQSHRRPDRFEDDYEEEYDRFRKRKEPRNQEEYNSQRSSRFRSRGKHSRDEEAVPAERPGYISGGRAGSSSRRKPQNDYQRPPGRKNHDRRPVYEDDDYEEYYDNEEDEIEDEKISRRNHRNRQTGRRDEYLAGDSKNDKRPSGRGSGSNSEAKNTSTSRNSDNAKGESDTQSKLQSGSNSKSSSNDDSFSKETSQNKDVKRTSANRQVGIDNQKLSSTTTEKYISDEEYDDDDDYEEPKQTSTTKTIDGKLSRKEYSKPSQTQSNSNKNLNDGPQSAVNSNEESTKNTFSSTTPASNNQEQSSYNRSPGLFRSRTSPLISQTQSATTPMTLNHRFSSTSPVNSQDSEPHNRFKTEGRSKIVSTTPSNYYKKQSAAPAVNEDNSEELSSTKPLKSSSSIYDSSTSTPSKEITEVPAYNIPSRSSAPSAVLYRRPLKSTASNTIETTTSYSDAATYSSQRPVAAIGYRRIVKPSDSDEKFIRKEQAFPPTGFSGNFRRPIIKGTDSDRIPQSTSEQTIDDSIRKSTQQPFISSPSINGNNQYRKVVKPSFDTSTPEPVYDTRTNYEEKPSKLSPSAPSTLNYRRPSISKPVVEDYPAEYDDGQKVVPEKQPALGLTYRRPLKTQKPQENQENSQDSIESSDAPVQPISTGNIYQKSVENPSKNEGSTIISLKSHYGFINSNRPKQNDDPTAPEAVPYNTRLLENVNNEKGLSFPRQPPRTYDSTAPGPSAPEESLQVSSRNPNYRQNQYNEPPQNPTTNFDLNIPEEEYDVTLNDALQPSTLHPTRSLADYPIQARLKSRGYQSRVTHPSRGAASYLLPSASQQYVARVQNTRSQDKTVESEPSQSKPSQTSADQEEYEAVVLSAPQYDTGSLHRWVSQQRQIRPAEWYW